MFSATHPARDTLPRLMQDTLFDAELRLRRAEETHLGRPYNLTALPRVPASLGAHLVTADAVEGMQADVMDWLAQVWGGRPGDDVTGVVVGSGSDANRYALDAAREALPGAVLLHGADAHPSVPCAARMLRIPALGVRSMAGGAMDMADLARVLAGLPGRPVVLVLTCGTTVTGAHDDIAAAMAVLQAAGVTPDQRHVHVDGAVGAMVLPFLAAASPDLRPDFGHGLDSISTCGHTMIGTPMPCAAVMGRRARFTMGEVGAGNGHAVLALWTRVMAHGVAGFAADALRCTLRAAEMAAALRSMGVATHINPHSLTVVFREPSAEIAHLYQLPCYDRLAHAIIMPSVTDSLIERFITDYCSWFRATRQPD